MKCARTVSGLTGVDIAWLAVTGGMLHPLGAACRAARTAAGLRQIDIATAADTTHATISRFETGKRWPVDPDRIVDAYAAELGVPAIGLWQAAVDSQLPDRSGTTERTPKEG